MSKWSNFCLFYRLKKSAPVLTRLMKMWWRSSDCILLSSLHQHQSRVSLITYYFYTFSLLSPQYLHVSRISHLLSQPETQDELEAVTNEIKKLANNARNKLKSTLLFLRNDNIIITGQNDTPILSISSDLNYFIERH